MFSKKFFYVPILLMFSCLHSDKQPLELDAYDIINLCLNEIHNKTTTPPVPPNWKGDTVAMEKSEKMKSFAVSPNLFEFPGNEKVKRIIKNQYNLFFTNESKVFDQLIEEKYIESPSEISVEISSFEEIDLKNEENWQPYKVIINFSKIRFNKTIDKACLIYSVAYAKNNGYSFLITLKKIGDNWELESSSLLTLS